MPTLSELSTVYADSNQGSGPYLSGVSNEGVWTSSDVHNSGWKYHYNLYNGVIANDYRSVVRRTYCVRGGRSSTLSISITSKPQIVGVSTALNYYPISFKIVDSLGKPVNLQNLTVSVSASSGATGGSNTTTTDFGGAGTISNWTTDTTGTITFTLSGTGVTSATFSAKVGAYPNTCLVDDGAFSTAEGGCKASSNHLVWSAPAIGTMGWPEAVWDSSLSGNASADGNDGGRTNDYDSGSSTTLTDTSLSNYCHDLIEGGKSDWRLPTQNELSGLYGAGAGSPVHFGFPGMATWFWTSTRSSATNAGVFSLASGSSSTSALPGNAWRVLCVRTGL
jgi:hypothetical protein